MCCDAFGKCGAIFASLLYTAQKLSLVLVTTAVATCLVVSLMVAGGVGVGVGYHYCIVESRTIQLDMQAYRNAYNSSGGGNKTKTARSWNLPKNIPNAKPRQRSKVTRSLPRTSKSWFDPPIEPLVTLPTKMVNVRKNELPTTELPLNETAVYSPVYSLFETTSTPVVETMQPIRPKLSLLMKSIEKSKDYDISDSIGMTSIAESDENDESDESYTSGKYANSDLTVTVEIKEHTNDEFQTFEDEDEDRFKKNRRVYWRYGDQTEKSAVYKKRRHVANKASVKYANGDLTVTAQMKEHTNDEFQTFKDVEEDRFKKNRRVKWRYGDETEKSKVYKKRRHIVNNKRIQKSVPVSMRKMDSVVALINSRM